MGRFWHAKSPFRLCSPVTTHIAHDILRRFCDTSALPYVRHGARVASGSIAHLYYHHVRASDVRTYANILPSFRCRAWSCCIIKCNKRRQLNMTIIIIIYGRRGSALTRFFRSFYSYSYLARYLFNRTSSHRLHMDFVTMCRCCWPHFLF